MPSLFATLALLALSEPASAKSSEEKEARDACDKLAGREQLQCIEQTYPKVHERVETTCKAASSKEARWDCRVKEYGESRIKLTKPTQPKGQPGAASPPAAGSAASTPGVLKWDWFNLAPWTGTAPSVATSKPAATTKELSLERDIQSGSPATGVSADYFVARVTGEILIETPGTHYFEVKTRYGAGRLTVGDQVVYQDHVSSGTSTEDGQLYFEDAGWTPFVFEYAHTESYASWSVMWRPPGASSTGSIPSTVVRAAQ